MKSFKVPGFILTLLILLPAAGFAADPPGIPDGWSDSYAYANGIRMNYYHAKAIVMLDPGLPRKATAARPPVQNARPAGAQTPRPSSNSDPLAFNMMGTPETMVKQNNYSYDDLVEKGKRDNPKWGIADIKYWALSKKQYHGAYSDQAWKAMSGSMRTENSLAQIPVPSLILKADTSPEGRKANEESVAGMPRVKLVHIDGAGHNLHHDELDQTTKHITAFLSNL